jgi:four helix bundle protein
MTNEEQIQPAERQYDLAERTARFGESAIQFCKTIKRNAITQPLIRQLVRSSTSVGANYLEADEAGSKKEFRYRISVSKRECRESQHWLRMLVAAAPECTESARVLWKEANELILIFGTIYRRSKPSD